MPARIKSERLDVLFVSRRQLLPLNKAVLLSLPVVRIEAGPIALLSKTSSGFPFYQVIINEE